MGLKQTHQPVHRIRPWGSDIARMIYPIAGVLQNSGHVGDRRVISVPVEGRLALVSRRVRQGVRVDRLTLVRCVADDPVPTVHE